MPEGRVALLWFEPWPQSFLRDSLYDQRLQGESQTPLSLHLESEREDTARHEKRAGDLQETREGRQGGAGNQREKQMEPQPLTAGTGQLGPDPRHRLASPWPHTDL